MSVTRSVTIAARFCGPPGSANGGYVSGLLAREIEGPAEITLRAPPPLDTPLVLTRGDDQRVTLHHGDTLLAEGHATRFELELPEPVSLAEAIEAAKHRSDLTFESCFVCGKHRVHDGGLLIHSGAVPGRRLVAAPWTPAADLGDDSGLVDPIYVWSALDCPSWFGHVAFAPPETITIGLLGRMSAQIERRPRVGEPCISLGWPIKKEGRRIYAASALFDVEGRALAWSHAIWVELKTG